MVTCDIKLFLNYVSVRRRPSEIILFQRVETCLENISKLFRRIIAAHEYFPYHFLVTHRKTHILSCHSTNVHAAFIQVLLNLVFLFFYLERP